MDVCSNSLSLLPSAVWAGAQSQAQAQAQPGLRAGLRANAGPHSARCTAAGGRLRACGACASGTDAGKAASAGQAAQRNSAQADLGLRLSKKASLSASETTVYTLIKFLPLSARLLLGVLQSVSRLQKLVNSYGGTVVRVPLLTWSREAPLVQVLGVRAMERFVAAYGGTDVYVPLCADFLRRLRNVNISRAFARLQRQGLSSRQTVHILCRHYSLSESRVRAIVRASKVM